MEVELLASVVRNCKHKTKQPSSTHLPRARPSAERRRQTPLGTDSIGPHQVNSYHGSGSPNLANPSQCVFGSLVRNRPVAMAAQFIGLQMLVTLRGEQPVRIKGTVSDVEAGTGLTLSNGEFFFSFFPFFFYLRPPLLLATAARRADLRPAAEQCGC